MCYVVPSPTHTLYLFLLFLGSWLKLSIFRSLKKKSQPSFSYLKISKLQGVVAPGLFSSTRGQRLVNLSEFKVSQAHVVSSRTTKKDPMALKNKKSDP